MLYWQLDSLSEQRHRFHPHRLNERGGALVTVIPSDTPIKSSRLGLDNCPLSVARHARVLTRARKGCPLTLAEPVTEPAG